MFDLTFDLDAVLDELQVCFDFFDSVAVIIHGVPISYLDLLVGSVAVDIGVSLIVSIFLPSSVIDFSVESKGDEYD